MEKETEGTVLVVIQASILVEPFRHACDCSPTAEKMEQPVAQITNVEAYNELLPCKP